jgi:hypothetical protein
MGNKNIDQIRPKGVKVMLDKERHMKLTFSGIAYLADQYGTINGAFSEYQMLQDKNPESGKNEFETLSIRAIDCLTHFIFAMLMHEDNKLTYESLQNLIDMDNMKDVFEAMVLSITLSTPKSRDSDTPQ